MNAPLTTTPDKLIATPNTLPGVSGHITWSRARQGASVFRGALEAAWRDAGLPDDWMLPASTPAQALRAALDTVAGKDQMVRPLGKGAWALVAESRRPLSEGETPKDTGLDYAKELGCQLAGEFVEFSPQWHPLIPQVQTSFDAHLDLVTGTQAAGWVAELAYRCAATSLRKMGGVYYVPAGLTTGERWAALAAVLQDKLGLVDIYTIPVMRESDAVRGVLDALTAEVQEEVSEILTGIDNANARGLRTRTAKVDALRAKLASYRDLLGDNLSSVEAALEAAGGSIAAAGVAAAAEAMLGLD